MKEIKGSEIKEGDIIWYEGRKIICVRLGKFTKIYNHTPKTFAFVVKEVLYNTYSTQAFDSEIAFYDVENGITLLKLDSKEEVDLLLLKK